jgi:hypothetical protein
VHGVVTHETTIQILSHVCKSLYLLYTLNMYCVHMQFSTVSNVFTSYFYVAYL